MTTNKDSMNKTTKRTRNDKQSYVSLKVSNTLKGKKGL
jgi:hypothetical protein